MNTLNLGRKVNTLNLGLPYGGVLVQVTGIVYDLVTDLVHNLVIPVFQRRWWK